MTDGPRLYRTYCVLSWAGGPITRTFASAAVAALCARGRRWDEGAATVVAVGGAGLLNSVVKRLVGRRRPRGPLGKRGDDNSFPSGHSSGSVALLGIGAYLGARRVRGPWAGILAFPCAGALAGLIGYSRVVLRRHHPGDVIAGHALGSIWLAVVLRTLRWWETKEAARRQPPSCS